jgi:hypothetical protein
MRQPSHHSMYAISGSSSVYHLLYPDQDYTLCGFRAEKHDAEIPAKATLHVVEVVPPNRELCKQCDKMNNRRKGNSGGPASSSPNPTSLLSGRVTNQNVPLFQVYEQTSR